VFCKDYDDFFNTCAEDSDSELDTGSVVREGESEEEVSDLTQPFVPHSVEHPRVSFLGVNGVIVDFDDETRVLECYQKFIDEEMWQLFGEQSNTYMPTNFL
jgi:hypothetical protein